MKNIVLIGASGSGKTSVGTRLSKHYGIPFVDTDKLVEERLHAQAPIIFQPEKDSPFRDAESEVIRELSRESGRIIATGDGVVLREENIRALKKRSLIVFVDRPVVDIISDLRSDDPSIYDNIDLLYRLYIAQLPLYNRYCDVLVSNEKSVEGCVQETIRLLEPLLRGVQEDNAERERFDVVFE